MALPTFNGFSLQDSNFITERIVFKGYASRGVTRGKVNRREGVKLLGTEFGEKEITVEGKVFGSSAGDLQEKLDDLKKNLISEQGNLIIETGRTYMATVQSITIPDEHYNQTRAPFEVTFICSNPFAEGDTLTAVTPVISGITTFSGLVTISGTFFARPIISYIPGPGDIGKTNIQKLIITHIGTGQAITVSGFGNGQYLPYGNTVTVNFDTFRSYEESTRLGNSGLFAKWEPGENRFIVQATSSFPGGSVVVTYKPRYI